MPISKRDLTAESRLSKDALRDSLRCCGLKLNAREYSDDEHARFKEARSLLDAGKTYVEVAAHFGVAWTVKEKKTATKKDTSLPNASDDRGVTAALPNGRAAGRGDVLDFPELKTRTIALGFPMEFGDLGELLEACELSSNGEPLAAERVEQFDEAVELLKQGKSLQDIRAHFGLAMVEPQTYQLPDLVNTARAKGHKLNYGQAIKAIKALGLDPNTREYSPAQAALIWKAFEVVAAGGSYDDVSQLSPDGVSLPQERIYERITARDSSKQLQTMNELAGIRARDLGPTMAKMEMQAMLRAFEEDEGYNRVWEGLGEYARARALGKNPKSQSNFGNSSESKLLKD